jgi:hypothetical protein
MTNPTENYNTDPFLDFIVRLRSVPHDVSATNRARRALKCLLRSFGFHAEIIPNTPAIPHLDSTAPMTETNHESNQTTD